MTPRFTLILVIATLLSFLTAHSTFASMASSPPARQPIAGGINPDITPVNPQHPLSESNPTLHVLLLNQTLAITRQYHLKHHHSSTTEKIIFGPVAYTTQVVAGTNFYVKLHVNPPSGQEYIHVRIFYQPWTQTTQLSGLLINQSSQSPLKGDFGHEGEIQKREDRESDPQAKDRPLQDAMADIPPMHSIRK